jgi:hypothetical protein
MRRVTLRYTPWRRLAYLRSYALANEMDGSFAKIGTIDYHYWAKRKMFLAASRNVSDCKQKAFYPRAENILAANRKRVETIEKSLSSMEVKKWNVYP